MCIETRLELVDHCGDDPSFIFHFMFVMDGLKAHVGFIEPYLEPLQSWNKMCEALENGTKHHLKFYQGNGEGYVDCDGTEVKFLACPSGSGGDLSVSFSLSLDKYGKLLAGKIRELITNEEVKNHPFWKSYN